MQELLRSNVCWRRNCYRISHVLAEKLIGISANQPKVKGGLFFVDSAVTKTAAPFVWLCRALLITSCFLAGMPGFSVGTKVERAGIIRSGAKMISAVATASVPKISVVLRKAYGAGLYAMWKWRLSQMLVLALPTGLFSCYGTRGSH